MCDKQAKSGKGNKDKKYGKRFFIFYCIFSDLNEPQRTSTGESIVKAVKGNEIIEKI